MHYRNRRKTFETIKSTRYKESILNLANIFTITFAGEICSNYSQRQTMYFPPTNANFLYVLKYYIYINKCM